MFSYISGTMQEKNQGYAVIDVNGIGFKIYTSVSSLADPACRVGDRVTFYTYMYIKEGIMDLYGFSAKAELELFEQLISVSGVGAKGAIAVLSLADPQKISVSILTDDAAFIKKASGIGAKTAQRICLELKDKISDASLSGNSGEFSAAPYVDNNAISDAIEALGSLGYTKSEAARAVNAVALEGDDTEALIKKALKNLF